MKKVRKSLKACMALGLIIGSCSLLFSCQESLDYSAKIVRSSGIHLPEHLMNKLYVGVSTMGRTWEPVPDSTLWQKATSWSKMPNDSIWHVEKGCPYNIVFICQGNNDPFGVDYGSDEQKHFDEILSKLNMDVKAYIDENNYDIFPEFYYAGVKDGVSFSADKELFGRKAGSNLADLIILDIPPSSKIAVTYPDYHVCKDYNADSTPITFSDYFKSGTALSLSYNFYASFAQQPTEEYDEITFTLEIPIECEYMQQIIYGEDYPESYYEQGFVERNENRVLRGSVKIKFTN